MITHFIFMSSSYSLGKRIAMDYIVDDEDIQKDLKIYLKRITEECGKDVSISTHMIQAEDRTWESVCRSDYFFKDVEVINSLYKINKKRQEVRRNRHCKIYIIKNRMYTIEITKVSIFMFRRLFM